MENLELGRRLAAAIRAGEVTFVYSPYRVYLGPVMGGELTCRVQDITPGPEMGRAFAQLALLPEAKEVHLHLLGLLLDKAQEVAMRKGFRVSINLDADSLTLEGVEKILSARLQSFVSLEITERAKVDDARLVLLKRLVAAGYRLALDDLGDRAHADADYVGWLLGTGLFSVVKLDFMRTNRLAQPAVYAEVEGLLTPYCASDLSLILEGSQAPHDDDSWQTAVDRLYGMWKGDMYTPLPEEAV